MFSLVVAVGVIVIVAFSLLSKQLEDIMATLADLTQAITDLQSKVAAELTVEQSAITLLQGLKKALDDALANAGDPAAAIAQIQAISTQIGTDTQALADAVTANTPTAPTPPTP